jgi:hypothetical protein
MNKNNWKAIVYLIGGAVGVASGLMAAHMYAQTAEANRTPGETSSLPAKVEVTDLLRLGIALVALIRQISDLGARPPARN